MRLIARVLVIAAAGLVLAGCAGNVAFHNGEKYELEGDWDRAVMFYRQALREDPDNIGYKTRLTKAVDMAFTKHSERAGFYLDEENADAALYEAKQAQVYSPGNERARQLVEAAAAMKELQGHITVGRNFISAGRLNDALDEFYSALEIDPQNAKARSYIESITKQAVDTETSADELSLESDLPVTLSFKEAKLKEVFEFLSKLSGISIVFDEDVKNLPVTVFARDVSFTQALKLMLATNNLFMKKIAEDAIIVIPKTKPKMDQYQDLMIRTYYLSNIKAKDMVNIIRTMLETRKVIINEILNSITLRETPEKLTLVEKLIDANDRKDSEVVIDVEVLSVDRTTSTKYGVNLPKSVTGTYDPTGVGVTSFAENIITNVAEFGSSSNLKDTGNVWFSYPAVTVDWSKNRGDTETLTNPQIRALNNQKAKILIGQRVPVQTGSTTGTTTTTTIEYRDVGIKLTVEPTVSLENDITLKTTLEVSSVGAVSRFGDIEQPNFNTTSVETVLNLKDGETVIIGGLLENIDQTRIDGIVGLVDTPILGKIFSTNTIGPNSKRELIMTLTPHVVRSLDMPTRDVTAFWSGTEQAFDTKPLFEPEKRKLSAKAPDEEIAKELAAAPALPAVQPGPAKLPAAPAAAGARQVPPPAQPVAKRGGRVGVLGFAPDVTPIEVGQEITIDVAVTDIDTLYQAPLAIIYNPKLVEFMKAEEGDFLSGDGTATSFMATVNDKVGYIEVLLTRLGKVTGMSGSGTLFTLTFKGKAPGISPLVFKQNTMMDENKLSVQADLKTGTLYVK